MKWMAHAHITGMGHSLNKVTQLGHKHVDMVRPI